jgi:hypothetical protein
VRVQVKEVSDFQNMNNWIAVCCILHNILNRLNDVWDDTDVELDKECDDVNTNVCDNNALGVRHRV